MDGLLSFAPTRTLFRSATTGGCCFFLLLFFRTLPSRDQMKSVGSCIASVVRFHPFDVRVVRFASSTVGSSGRCTSLVRRWLFTRTCASWLSTCSFFLGSPSLLLVSFPSSFLSSPKARSSSAACADTTGAFPFPLVFVLVAMLGRSSVDRRSIHPIYTHTHTVPQRHREREGDEGGVGERQREGTASLRWTGSDGNAYHGARISAWMLFLCGMETRCDLGGKIGRRSRKRWRCGVHDLDECD